MNYEQYRATYIAHCGMSNGKQPLLSKGEFYEAWERYEEIFSKLISVGMDPSVGLVKEYAELLYLLFVTEWERYCQINGLLEGD